MPNYYSIVHACIQTALVLPDVWKTPPWEIPIDVMLTHTSFKIIFAHCLFFTYISFDCITNKSKLSIEEWAHHVLTFIGLGVSLYTGPHYIGYLFLINEVSTIFLHLRRIVPTATLQFMCKICFFITFTIFRMGFNGYLMYWTMKHIGFGIQLLFQVLTYCINLYWYRKILYIIKAYIIKYEL